MNAKLLEVLRQPRVLHIGSGGHKVPADYFPGLKEVSLDIDAACKPDIVGSMVDMSFVPDECFDAIYTSHTLEHVASYEVRQCLWNFLRVLKPGGIAIVVVPNLEGIKATQEIVYQSDSGPISGLDMIYGHHGLVEGSPFMAHKCGFVKETLKEVLESVGFASVTVVADSCYNLNAVAVKVAQEAIAA